MNVNHNDVKLYEAIQKEKILKPIELKEFHKDSCYFFLSWDVNLPNIDLLHIWDVSLVNTVPAKSGPSVHFLLIVAILFGW